MGRRFCTFLSTHPECVARREARRANREARGGMTLAEFLLAFHGQSNASAERFFNVGEGQTGGNSLASFLPGSGSVGSGGGSNQTQAPQHPQGSADRDTQRGSGAPGPAVGSALPATFDTNTGLLLLAAAGLAAAVAMNQ